MQSDERPSEAACGAASSRTAHRSPGGPPGHPAPVPGPGRSRTSRSRGARPGPPCPDPPGQLRVQRPGRKRPTAIRRLIQVWSMALYCQDAHGRDLHQVDSRRGVADLGVPAGVCADAMPAPPGTSAPRQREPGSSSPCGPARPTRPSPPSAPSRLPPHGSADTPSGPGARGPDGPGHPRHRHPPRPLRRPAQDHPRAQHRRSMNPNKPTGSDHKINAT